MTLHILATGLLLALAVQADEPIIPPTISKVSPAGMQRGRTVTFTIDGRSLEGAKNVIFDAAGITAKISSITEVAEKITGPRAGVDLVAQVARGKKATARLEVTAAKDVEPGIHRFRIQTPLGTSNMAVIAIGSLPEIQTHKSSGTEAQRVQLPATLVGTIDTPGEKHNYSFEGKAGEEIVFQVVGSQLGSKLQSLLVLRDSSGKQLAEAGQNENSPDAVLSFKLPAQGAYTLSVADREKSGGMDHFYRVHAGPLPYITGVFPLGVRAGEPGQVSVSGVNFGESHQVAVHPPKRADGWTTLPLEMKGGQRSSLNKVTLAVGNEPEILEQEPNDTAAHAQVISLPMTINGHINAAAKTGGKSDEDYFRFHAKKGQSLGIQVTAARLDSRLDSVIEVLDARGNPIPRATVRCQNQTTTTLADRDSRTTGMRLVSTSGLREGDYLMIGDELDRIAVIPDQPDADIQTEGIDGLRRAFLGTSPGVRPINTPVYKAEILPADAKFPPNGLPVFHLVWRNDDGGPGYAADSRLDFVAPADGDYILHLKDVRDLDGADFAYRLTIRDAQPDYRLQADPENPNIPQGGSIPISVIADRLAGYEGAIEIEVQGLPAGVSAGKAIIPAGQTSTVVVLSAGPNASAAGLPLPIKIIGHASVAGHDLVRVANAGAPLQLASVIPPPDVLVTAEPTQLAIQPGESVTVTLHVARQNGFKGRVPCSVENLPPGVRVVNVGLNGVLVTESQSSRTFTLRAEDWAKPITQPVYVVGRVESNSPTMHPSAPIVLRVAADQKKEALNSGQAGATPDR
ncbi:MAG TPA: PPC domain-containing protein [Bryobacteraceae bacterium]